MAKAIIYNRDFSGKLPLPPDLRLQVSWYEWNQYGGPKVAIIKATKTTDRWDLIKLLRCPVEIEGKDGSVKWWGFVNRITIPQGTQRFGYSLDEMYNHIIVRYEQDGLTEAGTNAVSIAEYGQKEIIIRSYELTGLAAAQLRNVELETKSKPVEEIDESGGNEEIEIECIGWYDTLRWKHYSNTDETNVENTTQISAIATDTGQFLQGILIEDIAGVESTQARDARDGLSSINELLQAGTNNSRPLLARVDKDRYLHIYERNAKPPVGGNADYIMLDDGSLATLAGNAHVPDEDCKTAMWVQAKDSPNAYSFFIESATYNAETDKTKYRPAGGYEQRRLARWVQDIVTGDGPHVWPGLIPPNIDPNQFEPYWVALGKDGDDITTIWSVIYDTTNNLIYAGGDFSVIGGIDAENIAVLDMSTGQWSALGDGYDSANFVLSLAVVDSDLYIGSQGAASDPCFQKWDGSSFTDLAPGVNGPVNALAVDGTDIYLGGAFFEMPGSSNSDYISKYDTVADTFSSLGIGLNLTSGIGGCYGIAIDGSVLYATGDFDEAGGSSALYAAEWNGSSWSDLGGGLQEFGLDVIIWNGKPVFCGAFSGVYEWDGDEFVLLGNYAGWGSGLATDGENLYLAVSFLGYSAARRWDGAEWITLGDTGLTGGSYYGAFDIAMFDSVHPVYVGEFTHADGKPALGIAMYITTLEGLLDYVTGAGGVSRPGGPDKAIQYNYNGRFGGSKHFQFDYANFNQIIGNYTPPVAGNYALHQILEGASPAHYLWAFTSSYAAFLTFAKANGDSTTPTALLANEIFGRIRARGHDGSGWSNTQLEIRPVATENWSGSNHGTALQIWTTPKTSTTLTNHLIIDEDGLDILERGSDAGTPSTGRWKIYAKADGLYYIDDAGATTGPLAPSGAGLSYSTITPTTSDVSAAANTVYSADISGLTADRNFVVPAGTAGDLIRLYITTGDATYELIIIGDTGVNVGGAGAATEWSRVFITNEYLELECTATNTWRIKEDGRIACKVVFTRLTTNGNTTHAAGTPILADWNTLETDIGNMGDVSTDQANIRRAGYYVCTGGYGPAAAITDQLYANIQVWKNGTGGTKIQNSTLRQSTATTSSIVGVMLVPKPHLCAVGDYLSYYFATEETNRGLLQTDFAGGGAVVLSYTSFFAVQEVLR